MIRNDARQSTNALFVCEDGQAAPEYAVVACVVILIAISLIAIVEQGIIPTTSAVSVALGEDASVLVPSKTAVAVAKSPKDLSWVLSILLVLGYVVAIWVVSSIWRRRHSSKPSARRVKERTIDRFTESRRRIQSTIRAHRNELATWSLLAEHVVDREFKSVAPNASRSEVASKLDEEALGVVLVVKGGGEIVGAIQQEDIESSTATRASGIMRSVSESVDAKSHLSSVLELMHCKKLTWVPVVSCGSISGILSAGDIAAALLCTLQLISEIDQEYQAILHRNLGMSGAFRKTD